MVDYVLKYEMGNLIIIYHCMYFRLSGTIEDVIQNSMELMRDTEFSP